MGAGNVAQAFTYWTALDDRSFRVLCRMALVSLDNGNPPKYFAGRDDLAAALGKSLPPKPEDADLTPEAEADRKVRASVYEIVRKAVAKLVKEGVIVSSGDARFRNRAEYSLHLTPQRQTQQNVAPVTNESLPQQPQHSVAPMTQQNVAPMPQQSVATAPTDHCPLGVEEPLEEPLIGIQLGANIAEAIESPVPSEPQREIEIDLPKKARSTSKAAVEKQLAEDFNAWYAVYPKHVSRGAAETAYAKARKNGVSVEELITGARNYAATRKGQDPQFTKAPATWLNQKCWTDEPDPVAASGAWDPAFHVLPQYAFANQRMDHGDRALAKGAAMIAALEAREGPISQQPRPIPSRYPDGSQRRLQKGYELLVQTRVEQEAAISDIAAEFDEWFAAYPRHEGLVGAESAYTEARKAATAEQLLAGAQRYAADPNRDPQYTKLPANWLAGKGWQDSPLPLRRTGTSEDRMRANLQVLDGWSPGPRVDVFEQKALGQ